jgi:hypothetical protein
MAGEPQFIDGVDVEQLKRVFWLLREKLPLVLAANRYFEEHTGFHNEAGHNNLVDALSHLGTLVENAESLGPAGQAEQVAHLEDHLRRSMTESFELVLKYRLGTIADLWDEYMYFVKPRLRDDGERGLASYQELEERRTKIQELLDDARSSKRLTTWDEWETGTEALVRACELSDELARRLNESLAATDLEQEAHRSRRLAVAGLAAGVVGVVVAVLSVTGVF